MGKGFDLDHGHVMLLVMTGGIPMRRNVVRKMTESKYVVSPRLSGDGGVGLREQARLWKRSLEIRHRDSR
jgi:hypothetical protein